MSHARKFSSLVGIYGLVVAVALSFSLQGAHAASTTGSLAAVNASTSIVTDNAPSGSLALNLTGTFVGTVVFEATTDNTNWFAVSAFPFTSSIPSGLPVTSATAIGQFTIPIYGYTAVRVRCSAYTSGTISVAMDTSAASPLTSTSVGSTGVACLQQGVADSLQASATASAPTAGTTITTLTPGTAGTWEITYTTGILSGSPVAADAGNFQLLKNASVLLTNLPQPAALVATPSVNSIRITLLNTDVIKINAVGNATAAVVYGATIVAKRVS